MEVAMANATNANATASGADRLADVARATGMRTASDLAPPVVVPGPRPAPSSEQDTLPVRPEIAALLPAGGLRRGSVVSVRGSNTLLWMLLADATRAGSWAGLVGLPDLGLLAGLDLGVPADRLMLIPDPGPDLGTVLAALLDGVDLVVVDLQRAGIHRVGGGQVTAGRGSGGAGRIDPVLARRLANRARHRGGVILTAGPWPGADLELSAEDSTWSGLDHGAGYLAGQRLRLTVSGRGTATRPRTGHIALHPPTPTPAPPQQSMLSIVGTA
jgi:hypothetical protein